MTDKEARNVTWICHDCAMQFAKVHSDHHVATFHADECGVCKQLKQVTEPRDYAWPKPAKLRAAIAASEGE